MEKDCFKTLAKNKRRIRKLAKFLYSPIRLIFASERHSIKIWKMAKNLIQQNIIAQKNESAFGEGGSFTIKQNSHDIQR